MIPLSSAHCNWSKITMTSKICWFSAAVLISGSLAPRALHWSEAGPHVILSLRIIPQAQVPLLLLKVWVVHLTVDSNKYQEWLPNHASNYIKVSVQHKGSNLYCWNTKYLKFIFIKVRSVGLTRARLGSTTSFQYMLWMAATKKNIWELFVCALDYTLNSPPGSGRNWWH